MRSATPSSRSGARRRQRDPRAVIRTANVGLAIGADDARVQAQEDEPPKLMFGGMTEWVTARASDRHAAGRSSTASAPTSARGADWLILALRAPFDFDGLDLFIREVMPKFPPGGPA